MCEYTNGFCPCSKFLFTLGVFNNIIIVLLNRQSIRWGLLSRGATRVSMTTILTPNKVFQLVSLVRLSFYANT